MPFFDYGHGLTLAKANYPDYLSAWENNQYIYSNIQFSLDPMTTALIGYSNISDNANKPLLTFDQSPSVAVAPDGIGAILFVRNIYDQINGTNSNVFLALINQSGQLQQTINLTNNIAFGTNDTVDVLSFKNPHISITQDNQFIATWDERKNLTEGESRSIQLASISTQGVTSIPCQVAQSSDAIYHGTTIIGLNNSNAAVLGYLMTESDQTTTLFLAKFIGADICSTTPINIGSFYGRSLEMIQAGDSHILLGWVEETSDDVQTLLVNSTTLVGETVDPLTLANPDGRIMEAISMTTASGGFIVLTWENIDNDRLYYALMNNNGEVVTPPMIFHHSSDPNIRLQTGASGGSLAPLDSPLVFTELMPFIQR